MMPTTRRDSLVQSIASQPFSTQSNVSDLLDDTYLSQRLEKLLLSIDKSTLTSTTTSSSVETVQEKLSENTTVCGRYKQYTEYLDQLNANIEGYTAILDQTRKISDQFAESIVSFDKISNDTTQFIDTTNELYESHQNYTKLSQTIPDFLRYFESLDQTIRRLNHASSPNIVKKDSFKRLLSTIGSSLIFLESNSSFKNAETYRIKYKQCLIRACELISHYLINLLKNLNDEITQTISKEENMSNNARDALAYNKFASISESFFPHSSQLVDYAHNSTFVRYRGELNSILNDSLDQYFQIRSRLLNSIVWLQLDETIVRAKDANLVKFIQDNKSFFQQLCEKEYALFVKFFPPQINCKKAINNWFIKLCSPFYDTVRNKILRETDINLLCESVLLFTPYYEFEENSNEYLRQFDQIHYDKIFKPVMEILQNRLINRVQVYVDENISKYTPNIDDFIISNRKSKSEDGEKEDEDFVEAYIENFKDKKSVASVEPYYPPIVRGLALLFKIYEMINSVVFDNLAHYVLHSCIFSLQQGYQTLLKDGKIISNLDVRLSYLRNLLLLRNEMQNFNINYTFDDTRTHGSFDLSGMKAFFSSLRRTNSSIFSMSKDSIPEKINNMTDARSELVQELRKAIKEFTELASMEILGDILQISGESTELSISKSLELREIIDSQLPKKYKTITESIDNKEIAGHLIEAIGEYISQSYSEYYEAVLQLADSDKIEKGSINDLMYPDVFTEFLNNNLEKMTTHDLKGQSKE
ncbi:hypothetical protein KAFR_0B02430 [Kazachstania africana CBS 2517]|uniref:Conserved oligomeric Golgi complex subunit 3 n=1 Tax=Kazachstania africana (strain ATCC 22294 / BCRC 22015 / CBS 2517 / CECT 1963 / NBRC 1671 / NRRL Y-8276) TaxID=1071382 RepID=H2AQ91_KAZAF|nr:hypothetical protein KAFR_0B02430 [Kazachstania africana CBS 2517]CCF56541.1 hypothetical protein KAFR_0B02430 [Kazachstania africana CBS 2517]